MSANSVEELESICENLSGKVTSLQMTLKEKDETIHQLQSTHPAQGMDEAMLSSWFKTRISDFLEQQSKLAEELAEELAGYLKNEMEKADGQKQARPEYEQKLQRERECERIEKLGRQQGELEREQEKRERQNNERQRETIEIKKRECEKELCQGCPQAMDKLMKMDLNTARVKDIKEVMSKLDIDYVGLCERKELVEKLKSNVPNLWTKPESQQSSNPTQSYRYVHREIA